MLFLFSLQAEVPAQIPVLCDICIIMVKGVEDYVADPTNVAEVEAFLDQVCTILPKSLEKTCDTIINHYYEKLVQQIIQGYTPEVCCAGVGLC